MTIYHPNIPQAGDNPTNSQQDLLDNFQKLNADFSVNHLPFTTGGDAGWHKFISFLTAIATPGNTSGQSSAMYPRVDGSFMPTANEPAQLWFKNNVDRVQLTNIIASTEGGGNRLGFKTPWGFTINFGHAKFDNMPREWAVDYAKPPQCMVAVPMGASAGVAIAVKSVSETEFVGISVGNSQDCYFFAIGDSILDP